MHDQTVAGRLKDLDQNQQQDDRDEHHIQLKALVAITNRQIPQAAAAHHAGQGGIRHQRNGRDCRGGNDAGQGFRQQRADDDLPHARTHCQGGLNDSMVNLAQRGFHQARKKRRAADYERGNGAGHAQRCAGQHDGDRDHGDQQDDEGQGPQDVHAE